MWEIKTLSEYVEFLLREKSQQLDKLFMYNNLFYEGIVELNNEVKSKDGEVFKYGYCTSTHTDSGYKLESIKKKYKNDTNHISQLVLEYDGKPIAIQHPQLGLDKAIEFIQNFDFKSEFEEYKLKYHEYLKRVKQCHISKPVVERIIFSKFNEREDNENISISVDETIASIKVDYSHLIKDEKGEVVDGKGSVSLLIHTNEDGSNIVDEVNEIITMIEMIRKHVYNFYSSVDYCD